MIANVLDSIIKDLNQFLRRKYELKEDIAVISKVVNQDGSIPIMVENKIICSLIGIEQERVNLNYKPTNVQKNAPINLNMHLLFAANFQDTSYLQSLSLLSGLIAFFQGKKVFTSKNTPGLSSNTDKITLDIITISLKELTHLWGAIGAKYMPSIIYKIRMVVIDQNRLLEETTLISGYKNQSKT